MPFKSYRCFISGKEKIWHGLPNRERQILEVVLMHRANTLLRVSDLLKLRKLGSQATLHTALMKLKTTHYLNLTTDTEDGRVKFVSLAPKGTALFKNLELLIVFCASHK
jgi:DNA-binding MarR family transcriptional regulator